MLLGAGLFRFLEIAFFVFMAFGGVATLTYLYAPIKKLVTRKLKKASQLH